MSATTGIEWTDATWNPVTGCTEVSPACDCCFARTLAERFRGTAGHYFENGFDLQLRPDKLSLPLLWRKPRRVFVNSMSDLFHGFVPDAYIAEVFSVMARAKQHTFQVLTKRHGRMRSLLNRLSFRDNLAHLAPWPLPNVWLGVSVENQQWADIRIPALLDTPAAARFLSCEPLLGPVVLRGWVQPPCECCALRPGRECVNEPGQRSVDWVIVGGESGHGARPMHPDWARRLRDQCTEAAVPFHFKQWGEWAPESVCATRSGAKAAQYLELDGTARPARTGARGAAVTVQRNGKHKTGRQLDGRTWDQYPADGA